MENHLTNSAASPEISESREVSPHERREMNRPAMDSLSCPYCASPAFVRRGFRVKLREKVQLYQCASCGRTFTAHSTRGKQYPLSVMFDAISIYNLGYSFEKTVSITGQRHQVSLSPSTLAEWIAETADLCRYSRMREFAMKKYSPREMVITATLAHQQLYRYRFHRGKCDLMIREEYEHRKFTPLKEFLEMVPAECPHQYFQEGLRASETPLTFSKKQMIVRAKQNYATRLAAFVLQSVKDRKLRHEALQKFFLANDSVTVATEVPVYLTRDDLEHMKTQLGFDIFSRAENCSEVVLPKLITGHIDLLQIRNGQIHILDYKPRAEKEKPIEQLTLYAMALSRLTGLRLYEFKCAWFDEKDYFEFYPLHVLYKPKKTRRRRKVTTMEGVYTINQETEALRYILPIIVV
ncbi:PD-(D/E)XK nuclease family protein [Candidatus Gottesmanbacteria bacterium]|nr:PD-(D/E)XK nuclease family protein [Candidatus Gottesmanbacteria bacterium]